MLKILGLLRQNRIQGIEKPSKNKQISKKTIRIVFEWFLGRNHLRQIVYNPVTGGCFDGLEEHEVNINQGAESTISYLMARLKMEDYKGERAN